MHKLALGCAIDHKALVNDIATCVIERLLPKLTDLIRTNQDDRPHKRQRLQQEQEQVQEQHEISASMFTWSEKGKQKELQDHQLEPDTLPSPPSG